MNGTSSTIRPEQMLAAELREGMIKATEEAIVENRLRVLAAETELAEAERAHKEAVHAAFHGSGPIVLSTKRATSARLRAARAEYQMAYTERGELALRLKRCRAGIREATAELIAYSMPRGFFAGRIQRIRLDDGPVTVGDVERAAAAGGLPVPRWMRRGQKPRTEAPSGQHS